MTISLDSILPVTSATITTSRNNNLVKVELASDLGHEVLTDLQRLESQPYVRFLSSFASGKMFDVFVNSNYPLESVAEAIAQMLEGHGLRIGRLAGLVEKCEVSSFTAQLTQEGDRPMR